MQHQTDLSNALESFDRPFGMTGTRAPLSASGAAKAEPPSTERLTLRTRRERGALVMEVSGRIDGSNAAKFKSGLLDAIEDGYGDGGCNKVILDMAGLDLISARGLRALIEAQRRIAAREGSFLLARPGVRVAQIIAISRCDTLFAVRRSIAEALESESD